MSETKNTLDLEQDFENLDTRAVVESAIKEAFGNDNAQNNGTIENHCGEKTKEYYLNLANGNDDALEEQENILKEFLADEQW